LDKPTLGNSNTKKQRLHDTPGLWQMYIDSLFAPVRPFPTPGS
jgi:hypothetical protein